MWSIFGSSNDGTRSRASLHRGWRATLVLAITLGFAVVLVYVSSEPEASLGLAVLLTGGCLLSGGFVGFLFGIPKALQGSPAAAATGDNPQRTNLQQYRANTNLEEVSDWLTKILVGVGLTQLTQLPAELSAFGAYFGAALGSGITGERFAIAALIYFSVAGFLFAYLWTRLFLGGALAEADALSRVEERLDEQQRQAQQDAEALALVARYLQPGDAATSVDDTNRMKEAIKKASVGVKVQAFYQAATVRGQNWQQAADKPLMERTIPVFEALAEADTEKKFHRTWGQLGFALKDQRTPDWARAASALSTAIRIRGDAREFGYWLYEFNRAVCRIAMDPNFTAGRPSAPAVQADVHADLEIASEQQHELIERTPEIVEWLRLNPTNARAGRNRPGRE